MSDPATSPEPVAAPDLAPNAARFAPASAETTALWSRFGNWDKTYFPSVVGLQLEEIRTDYARMRLPYRPELDQPAGVVHGGAIATLIDTVVVPAVGGPYPTVPVMLTLSMTVNYLGAVIAEDVVAEGWVTRRGRSIVFCEVAVLTAAGQAAATGTLVYKVRAG